MNGELLARDEGPVRVLTLRRAPGNTLGRAALEAMRGEVGRAARDRGVRALVLASALEGYFSSGLDLEEVMSQPQERRGEMFESLLGLYRDLLEACKPVVGALSGTTVLGGWVVAMGCDWRVLASDTGKIALSEVRLGLTPTPALIARLSSLASDQRAVKEMVLRGKTLRAEDALAAGLVDEIVPEAEVLPRALALAKRLAKSPPTAFAALKRGLNEPSLEEALWRRSMEEFRTLISGAEAREGMEAMRAKRRPRWEDS